MDRQAIAATLRQEAHKHSPSGLARLALDLGAEGMGQFFFISLFFAAFPEIPLQRLIEASVWEQLPGGNLSDAELDEMLKPWLPGEFLGPPRVMR